MKIFLFLTFFASLYGVYSDNPYRLPKSVKPYHYNLQFYPDFYDKPPEKFRLQGRTIIDAKVLSRTRYFCLHAFNITMGQIRVIKDGRNLFKSKTYNADKHWYLIFLKEALKRGDKIQIEIRNYNAPIKHNMIGLYYYSQKNTNGTWTYGVTTQLQPTYARNMFPCFDEPAMKATFDISIIRKKPFFSVSNGPLSHQKVVPRDKSFMIDYFKTTPMMATYLVAVIVTNYKALSEMHRGVNFTLYYPPGKEHEIQVSMKFARKSFDYAQDYFDVKYPMKKLDQIGFESKDYWFAGMENYGMITYKDWVIYAKSSAKKTELQGTVGVICHEITHQWFGNLVTMKWWDDLWLNEGMTQFFSFMRNDWFPNYHLNRMGNFLVLTAMSSDLIGATPVYVPSAKSPKQILNVVNAITYSKGGSIIKMAELIMGKAVFKDAMRTYIKTHKYGSVTHSLLFKAFTKANRKHQNGLNMEKILIPWLKQSGVPLLNVTIDEKAGTISYDQSLFYTTRLDLKSVPGAEDMAFQWPIPIQWKTGNNGISKVIVRFDKKGTIVLSEKLYPSDWLVVNPEANYYYVVNYEPSHWKKLAKQLSTDHLAFDEFTRGKLLYDAFQLFRATKDGRGNFMDMKLLTEIYSYLSTNEKSQFPRMVLHGLSQTYEPLMMPLYKSLMTKS